MNGKALNTVLLNTVRINTVGTVMKKISRYVPDNEIPDSHTVLMTADSEQFMASDTGFYVKN